jgi:hypothetical protein
MVGSEASKLALEVDASEASVGVGGVRKRPHPGLRSASAFPPHRFAGGGRPNRDPGLTTISPHAIAHSRGEVN